MSDPAELGRFGPLDRLSVASSARSSLPSLMGDGEEGGGEDPWNPSGMGLDLVIEDLRDEKTNWKKRYEELEYIMKKFRLRTIEVQDNLEKKVTELQRKVWTAERKAQEAEEKARIMEQRFSEVKNSTSAPVPFTCDTFHSHSNEECSNSQCVISSLEQQIEEQKNLRILDAKQVEDKAGRIKEWVTNKLKELEEQNQHLREQNKKCNVQLEVLKVHLNQMAQLSPNNQQKQMRDRGSTEDSSRGSFEDQGDSDDSLPHPEVFQYSPQPSVMLRAYKESNESEDYYHHCSSPLPQENDPNAAEPSTLYASIDYSSKRQQIFTDQIPLAPPRLKLERKKYALDGCFTPSTISTTSEHRLSDLDCWNRKSSRIDSGSADIDTPNSMLSPELNPSMNCQITCHSENVPSSEDQGTFTDECLLKEECDARFEDQAYAQRIHFGNRPLTAPNPFTSSLDDIGFYECDSHMRAPDKNALTLDTLSLYKEGSYSQDELHDYAEIYTPNKECSDFYTDNDECESVVTDDLMSSSGKPPTPPLHRFPSWESKIYEVAAIGINISSKTPEMPKNDSSNNNQCTTSNDLNLSNASFVGLSIPVYATVKGRASQIRSVPFTGESSDSSDNEDTRVTMTTTSSQTNSGDTESSASVGGGPQDRSPVDKKLLTNKRAPNTSTAPNASNSTFSKCHGVSSSPMKRREMSSESVLSDDYAVPPDAVSVDVISVNSSDNRPSVTNTPTLIRRMINCEEYQKKENLEKSGHLTKLGGKFKTWRRRWFVLKNGMLSYYKSQNDSSRKPQGQIVLDNICRVNRAEGAATFEISTGKRTYYLTADSIILMEEWIKVLQNVLRRNATKLLLTKDDTSTVEGWLTKVKHGHSRRCWCLLIGRMFLYFKTPNDCNPLGQINMRDSRVEEVVHVSDSDEEDNDRNKVKKSEYTIGIFPNHQGPTYLLMDNKQEMDSWLYHLTVVSSGDNLAGTQYEQLIAKLMEVNGDENCVVWRHPLLLYSKDPISQPLSTLPSELLQQEAVKLFKSLQLFMSVPLDTSGIEYHVVLAQNSLLQCLTYPELQNELFCQLIKQTSKHCHQKIGVQQLLICATQSLFLCDTSSADKASAITAGGSEKSLSSESKLNPAPFVFVQAWQLLALAVSLFVPKNRTLWYLRMHLQRNANTKLEAGKYAIFCQRALERGLVNGERECKPSRMEVLSILLKNPYHHSLPHSIPVHFMNGSYQVFGFDGSTTIHEFTQTVNNEIGVRECEYSGFSLFSDDPIEKDLEHCLVKEAKLCDVISQWEQALRVQHLGKFENTKVLKLLYKNRLILHHNIKAETDKERLLLVYQINEDVMEGKFPLSKQLAIELAALLAQIEFGDYVNESCKTTENSKPKLLLVQVINQYYPTKFRDAVNDKQTLELIKEKWLALRGRSSLDCVRIYLNCARKWSFSGGKLFQAKFKSGSLESIWLAVAENCIAILDVHSLQCIVRYTYSSVMTFGGCKDDFMLVVCSQNPSEKERSSTERLLFSMTKPKILEITLLIADYMNATFQHDTSSKRCSSSLSPFSRGSFSSKFRSNIRANNTASQNSNAIDGSVHLDSSPDHGKSAMS